MSNVHGPLFKSPVGNPRQGIALQRVKAQVRLPSKRSFHAVCVDGFPGRVDLIGTSERRLPSRLQRARPLPLRFCLEGSASSLPQLRRLAAYFGAATSKPPSTCAASAASFLLGGQRFVAAPITAPRRILRSGDFQAVVNRVTRCASPRHLRPPSEEIGERLFLIVPPTAPRRILRSGDFQAAVNRVTRCAFPHRLRPPSEEIAGRLFLIVPSTAPRRTSREPGRVGILPADVGVPPTSPLASRATLRRRRIFGVPPPLPAETD